MVFLKSDGLKFLAYPTSLSLNMTVRVMESKDELLAAQGRSCILMYTGERCPPCNAFKPRFVQLAKQFSHVEFYLLFMNSVAFRASGRICSLPTFRRYEGGKLLGEVNGPDEAGVVGLLS